MSHRKNQEPEQVWRVINYYDAPDRFSLLRWPAKGALGDRVQELASGSREACEAALRLLEE